MRVVASSTLKLTPLVPLKIYDLDRPGKLQLSKRLKQKGIIMLYGSDTTLYLLSAVPVTIAEGSLLFSFER